MTNGACGACLFALGPGYLQPEVVQARGLQRLDAFNGG